MAIKKGVVKITNALISKALGFPIFWEIEEIRPSYDNNGIKTCNESEMLISGHDFPEVNNKGQAEEVTLIVHEKVREFEIKKIDK